MEVGIAKIIILLKYCNLLLNHKHCEKAKFYRWHELAKITPVSPPT